MALDIDRLWDHAKPELSEQRFRAALDAASADEKLILQTRIARTHGLSGDFDKARRELLAPVEPRLDGASAEVKIRYLLELGRGFASTAHPEAALTPAGADHYRDRLKVSAK